MKFFRIDQPQTKDLVKGWTEEFLRSRFGKYETKLDDSLLSGRKRQNKVRRTLGADILGIHSLSTTIHDGFVKCILNKRRHVCRIPKQLGVGLVFGEEWLRVAIPGEDKISQCGMVREDLIVSAQLQLRPRCDFGSPALGISKPKIW